MSMGMMDDDEFNRELERLNNKVPSAHIPASKVEVIDKPGRKTGDNNVPDILRKVIAEDALMNGRQSALGIARDFGISGVVSPHIVREQHYRSLQSLRVNLL